MNIILGDISRNGTTFVVTERYFSYENDFYPSETITIANKLSDKNVVNLRHLL